VGRDGDPSRSLPNLAGLDVTLISSGGTSENVYGSKRESIVFPTTFTAESDCPAICGMVYAAIARAGIVQSTAGLLGSCVAAQLASVQPRVAGGVSGSHFQRDHRYPGTHPLISARFFALADTGVDLAGFQRVDRRLVPGWYFIPPVRAVGW